MRCLRAPNPEPPVGDDTGVASAAGAGGTSSTFAGSGTAAGGSGSTAATAGAGAGTGADTAGAFAAGAGAAPRAWAGAVTRTVVTVYPPAAGTSLSCTRSWDGLAPSWRHTI